MFTKDEEQQLDKLKNLYETLSSTKLTDPFMASTDTNFNQYEDHVNVLTKGPKKCQKHEAYSLEDVIINEAGEKMLGCAKCLQKMIENKMAIQQIIPLDEHLQILKTKLQSKRQKSGQLLRESSELTSAQQIMDQSTDNLKKIYDDTLKMLNCIFRTVEAEMSSYQNIILNEYQAKYMSVQKRLKKIQEQLDADIGFLETDQFEETLLFYDSMQLQMLKNDHKEIKDQISGNKALIDNLKLPFDDNQRKYIMTTMGDIFENRLLQQLLTCARTHQPQAQNYSHLFFDQLKYKENENLHNMKHSRVKQQTKQFQMSNVINITSQNSNRKSLNRQEEVSEQKSQNGQEMHQLQNTFIKSQNQFIVNFIPFSSKLILFDLTDPHSQYQPKIVNYKCSEQLGDNFGQLVTPSGDIFVIGGTYGESQRSKKCYKYNFSHNQLSSICSLEEGVENPSLCYSSDCLYCFGGLKDSDIISQNSYKYVSIRDMWIRNEIMPVALKQIIIQTLPNNKILIFGVRDGGKVLLIYNTLDNSWTQKNLNILGNPCFDIFDQNDIIYQLFQNTFFYIRNNIKENSTVKSKSFVLLFEASNQTDTLDLHVKELDCQLPLGIRKGNVVIKNNTVYFLLINDKMIIQQEQMDKKLQQQIFSTSPVRKEQELLQREVIFCQFDGNQWKAYKHNIFY